MRGPTLYSWLLRLFPEEFRVHATSLAAHRGAPVDRVAFAQRLFSSLETVLDAHARGGFEAIRPRFESRFRMCGRPIQVRQLDGAETRGTARGIDADGALLLERDDAVVERVIAGDVTLAKAAP